MEELNEDSLLNVSQVRTKILMIECAYCEASFKPSKRWTHIYCSGSCRTLACRERRKGISGTLHDKIKSTSVTDLYHSQENLFGEMKDLWYNMNWQMNQMMILTNQIKFAQEPERIKDIDRRIEDWQSRGFSQMPEKLQAMQLTVLKIEITTALIMKQQDKQQWITIIGSLFGNIIGEQIWSGIKKVVTGKQDIPIEERFKSIMDLINAMTKK